MNIRTKTIGITALTLFLAGAVVYLVSSPIVMRGFEKVENDNTTSNINRAHDAIQAQVDALAEKVADWSEWDALYQFVSDKNPGFINDNFGNDPQYESPIFDTIIFYNREGKFVYSNGGVPATPELLTDIPLTSPLLRLGNAANANGNSLSKGFIVLSGDKIAEVASRPILHTDLSGPPNGSVIFVHYLDKDQIKDLANSTHLNLGLYALTDKSIPSDAQSIVAARLIDVNSTKILGTDSIAGYVILPDINGKAAILERIQLPRPIYKQGESSIRLVELSVLIVGATSILLSSLLLDRLIISRVKKLTTGVELAESEGDIRSTVPVEGNDELASLANTINQMLKRIKQLTLNLEDEKTTVEHQVAQRTQQLEEEKSLFATSINNLPLGFMLVNAHGHVLMINPQLEKIFKLKHIITKDLQASLAHPDGPMQQIMDEAVKVVEHAKPVTKEIATADGRFLLSLMSPVLHKSGNVARVVILIEDITEAKILQRSRDEFFSIASHELRTPLTAIRGNSSMIEQMYKDQLKDPELHGMINDIHASSVRLIAIVNDFLDASRLEQGRMVFNRKEFALKDIVQQVAADMSNVAEARKLYLKVDDEFAHLPKVKGDPDRTKQVVYNLVGNALKFTDTGGVTIQCELSTNKSHVKVKVSDTGHGIGAEGQQLLFHKFQQANDDLRTRDATDGTGLGLYISKLLVEKMGGKLELEHSTPGEGSTFTFTIPVA